MANASDKKFNIKINGKRTSVKITLRLYELFLMVEQIEENEVIPRIESIITQEFKRSSNFKYTTFNRVFHDYIHCESMGYILKLEREAKELERKLRARK